MVAGFGGRLCGGRLPDLPSIFHRGPGPAWPGPDVNTPAHLIFAAALLARPGARAGNMALLAGATIPDVSMPVMIIWQHWAENRTLQQVFEEDFRSVFWQGVFAVDNSIPLWALVLVVGLLMRWRLAALCAAAALLHVSFDLVLHNEDARRHFWPLSDWMFRSPISYWDPARYGRMVGAVEGVAALALCAVLWRRFDGARARALIVMAAGIEVLPTLALPILVRLTGG